MTLECEHCGSHNYKVDYIEGYAGQTEIKCMMCGRKKFKEVEMANKTCSIEGCEKHGNIKGLCYAHYHEKYGKPYQPPSARPKKERAVAAIEEKPTPLPKPRNTTIVIDFFDHDELLEAVKENARNEMRSPEMQILWIIKTLLDKAA